ncbi:MAG: hypothetical protein ACQETH_05190 [Candidatus Rifleibacteriota bacterium]
MRIIFALIFFMVLLSYVGIQAQPPDLSILGSEDHVPDETQKGYEGYSTQYKLTSDGKISISISQPTNEEETPPLPAAAPQVTEPTPAEPVETRSEEDPVIGWEFHYGTPSGEQIIYRSKEEFGADYNNKDAVPIPDDWTYWNSNPVRESGARE